MKIYLLIFVFMVTALFVRADETNTIYVTDNGKSFNRLFLESKERGIYLNPEKVEAAKTNRESLSAKYFPEGNWGEVTNGYQLSLRFTKLTYANGEPIVAILLFRNATNQIRDDNNRYLWNVGWFDGPAKFQITTDSGKIVPESRPEPIQVIQGGNVSNAPFPHTQRKHLEHLNKDYELPSGKYMIQAYIEMFGGLSPLTIKSAPVLIKVE
jgi:hypothetical protein